MNEQHLIDFQNALVAQINGSGLDPKTTATIMAKMASAMAIGVGLNKEDFLSLCDWYYEWETYNKNDREVH
jgi:hypothetical protein